MIQVENNGLFCGIAIDKKSLYLSVVMRGDNTKSTRIISFDYNFNEKVRFNLTEKVPDRFFPPKGILKVYQNQFYLNSINSNSIYILNKDFTDAGKIEFKGLPEGYELSNLYFWGNSLVAYFRDRSISSEGPTVVRRPITVLFDRDGKCKVPKFIDDKAGTGMEIRMGNQTEYGFLVNHWPVENILEEVKNNDPKWINLNSELRQMILSSKLGDNPVIKIYWLK